jgi:hypothetical protein
MIPSTNGSSTSTPGVMRDLILTRAPSQSNNAKPHKFPIRIHYICENCLWQAASPNALVTDNIECGLCARVRDVSRGQYRKKKCLPC